MYHLPNNKKNRLQRILEGVFRTKLHSDNWIYFIEDSFPILLSYYFGKYGKWEYYKEHWDGNVYNFVKFLFDEKTPISEFDLWDDLRPVLCAKSRTQCMNAMERLCENITSNIAFTCHMCRNSIIFDNERICMDCVDILQREHISFIEWKERRLHNQTSVFIAECASFWLRQFLVRDVVQIICTFVASDAGIIYENGIWRKRRKYSHSKINYV